MKSALSINVEYAVLRGACWLVNAIPYRGAMVLAEGFGVFAFDVLRFQRRRTLQRIRSVFPEKSEREARCIARASLVNLVKLAFEMMRAPSLDRAWMDVHVADGLHYKNLLQELVDEGHGVVIFVPHAGNWYMAAWSMAKYGLPLAALGARQRNPKLDAWMKRSYGDIDFVDRDDRGSIVQIVSKIRSGKAFAILPDLRVRKPDCEVDFFGGKANVSRAGAKFAVNCGAPIVVAAMRREKGKHCFAHLATLRPDPAAPDANEEARRLTREAMAILDNYLRDHPGDWFWYNKRWILEPAERISRIRC